MSLIHIALDHLPISKSSTTCRKKMGKKKKQKKSKKKKKKGKSSSSSSEAYETADDEDTSASSESDLENLEDKEVTEVDKYNAELKKMRQRINQQNAVAELDSKLMRQKKPTDTKDTGTRSKTARDRKENQALEETILPNDLGPSTAMITSASGAIPKNLKTSSQTGT